MTDDRAPLTTTRTIRRGTPTAQGWRELREEPGEPLLHAIPDGQVLAVFWHLSDLHLCDCESPARIEYLDRYSDPDSELRESLGDIGTYRPQESLTAQVAVTMVQTVNEHLTAPVSGAPVDVVLLTGDLTDNAQRNELRWYQALVEGGTITPWSGDPHRSAWVGATDPETWDERYWHPDGPPEGQVPDRPCRVYGYPTIPGLVAAARRDIQSPGLSLPWISVYGNHDGLLQGTVAPTPGLRELAVGGSRIIGMPLDVDPMTTAMAIAEVGPASYFHDASFPTVAVARDPERDFTDPAEFARTMRPDGSSATYFSQDVGALRVITLDTVNPHGGWQGSLGLAQFEWLLEELNRTRDRHVVVASHHPSYCLTNGYAPERSERRILENELLDLLLRSDSVIAWVAGHVHAHGAVRHERGAHAFMEVTSASLIDWPQQGRILEVMRLSDSEEIAIVSTVVDHRAPARWTNDVSDVENLASISRALAANDYRLRDSALRGLRLDSSPDVRNVVWRVPDLLAR